jgi:hypothetical protein
VGRVPVGVQLVSGRYREDLVSPQAKRSKPAERLRRSIRRQPGVKSAGVYDFTAQSLAGEQFR